jgi:hypothetical protein
MDLTINCVVVTDAIKFVQTNKEKLTMSTTGDNNGKESKEPIMMNTKISWKRKQENFNETTDQVF